MRVWYKSQSLLRRVLSVTLLIVIAIPLIGAVAFASVCLEPCPDDTDDTSCPPVCVACTTCTHAQQAIMQTMAVTAPYEIVRQAAQAQPGGTPSHPADDIFHVPLAV